MSYYNQRGFLPRIVILIHSPLVSFYISISCVHTNTMAIAPNDIKVHKKAV
jgi:hypothetical protein